MDSKIESNFLTKISNPAGLLSFNAGAELNTAGMSGKIDESIFDKLKSASSIESIKSGVETVDSPLSLSKKSEPIKDADIPTFNGLGLGTTLENNEASKEKADEAYEKFSSYSKEDQEALIGAYKNAIEDFQREKFQRAVGTGYPNPLTKEEFLEKHPEYKMAMELIEPMAREYNGRVQRAVNEWSETAKWYEKIGARAGINIPSREAAIEEVQKEFADEYPGAQEILELI